jgi:16S rRNA (guanine527-N7)-methyltransferase
VQGVSSAEIGAILAPYYPATDGRLADRVAIYISVLQEWNRKISLTTVTDPIEITKFHFGESLFAASALKIHEGRLADVGSGAGFPGVPLAMAIPGLRVSLIEANAKKAAFLCEVARLLSLSNVNVIRSRWEDISEKAPFDFICARALGDYESLIRWSSSHLNRGGILALFLGQDDAENVVMHKNWLWRAPIKIPGSDRRYLLSGSPL